MDIALLTANANQMRNAFENDCEHFRYNFFLVMDIYISCLQNSSCTPDI